jgi:transcriptional regulator with XRE-family HTH domain
MPNDRSLKALGFAIRQIRQKKNWSQEELAEYAGLHRNYVSSTERGERNIALINILKIAQALNLKGSELLKLALL